jgi:ubiquinone/menaquinone biosynthesis C-methylase UbiE
MGSQKFDFFTRVAVYPTVLERTVEMEFALSHVRQSVGRRVLDIGVGEFPSLWYALTQCGYDVVGTDIIKGYFANTPIGLANHLLFDDITQTQFKDNRFDCITCVSTLEHIPDWQAAISNMRKVCAKDGRVIITIPYSVDNPCDNIKTRGKLTRIFSPIQVRCLGAIGPLVAYQQWRCWTGNRWRSGDRLPRPVEDGKTPDLICLSYKVQK